MSTVAAKGLGKKALNAALMVGGFAVGWQVFTLAEDNNWISESTQRKLNIANLKLQLHAQRLLPTSVVDKYGYSEDVLRSLIDTMEKGYTEQAMNDRVTFDQILSECDLPEQIGFLEEHASEEIPYFYIADIFHSWARLHEATFLHAEKRAERKAEVAIASPKSAIGAGPPTLRDVPALNSKILCNSLWDKMLHHVIPFDVSIRALCVLAVNNKANAKRLAQIADVNDLLSCYEAYLEKEKELGRTGGDDLVDHGEVYAATLFFLSTINDTSVHQRWIPGIGRPSTGRYPLAVRVEAERWCRLFAPSNVSQHEAELLAEPAALFSDVMCEKLRCGERCVS